MISLHSENVKKVVYIISDIDKALAFEWIAEKVNQQQFELFFILLNPGPSTIEEYLRQRGIPVCRVVCRTKKEWPRAFWKTYQLLRKIKPDVVHCHLIQANIIGLSAAKLAGIKKRIYTRHYSTLHHIYFPKGVWWDKLSNWLATDIIAISGVVENVLLEWEHANNKKIVLIPHGFLLEEFRTVSHERISSFRERYQLPENSIVIGVISRFTEWKGIQYIIPAFKKFQKLHPDSILLLLNAKGDFEQQINCLLDEVPIHSYRKVTFEHDVAAAYKAMDFFVHVPIDDHSEAFGQIYVEALASGVPCIATLSGIAKDFMINHKNAMIVPYKDSEAIYEALEELYRNEILRTDLIHSGWCSVKDNFDLENMIHKLERLYAGQ